jgi:hypothetical protein
MEAADVLARAAVAGRGFGEILMSLSNGVAARIGMTDTAYPLRGTGSTAPHCAHGRTAPT